MRKEILLLCCFANIGMLFAQNYQTVVSNRTYSFFGDQVESIRIDSVFYQNDSIFYPFYNIQTIDSDCFLPFSYSWIGEKIIIKNDGYNCFINRENDTVKINTLAQLNESWIAYQTSDAFVVMAKVINYDTMTFLGQTDSVKTISFCAYNQEMDSISHKVNDMTIILSKNFGLIETLNFSLFTENISIPANFARLQSYKLIGLSNPEIGIVNLTWKDIYNFDVGDEIHIADEKSYSNDSHYRSVKQSVKYIYLDKKEYSDSIIYIVDYEMEEQKTTVQGNTPIYENNYTHDTIQMLHKMDSILGKLSGEIVYTGIGFSDVRIEIGKRNKKILYSHAEIEENRWGENDSCWSYVIKDGCFGIPVYYQGLGGPYHNCSYFMDYSFREFRYYKKGNETWGTPITITPIMEYNPNNSILVYPNPASDYIFVQKENNISSVLMELFDLQGKLLIRKPIQSNNERIDIAHLGSGVYFYRLTASNKQTQTGKIIKH